MYIYNFHTCDITYLYSNSQLVREIKLCFGKRIWAGACVHVATFSRRHDIFCDKESIHPRFQGP